MPSVKSFDSNGIRVRLQPSGAARRDHRAFDARVRRKRSKGVVKVTASGFLGDHEPENTVDLKSHSYFRSADSPNSWICYDFGGGAARDPDELLDKVVPRWARWLSPQVVGPRGLKRRDRGLVVGH